MIRQSLHFRRAATIGLMGVAALGLVQCERDRSAPDPASATGEAPPVPDIATQTLAPAPVLTRGELITAVSQAASVFAVGGAVQGADPLVGRRLSLRLPFGCHGPAPVGEDTPGLAQWRWGEDQRTLRLSLQPLDWTGSPLVGETAPPAPAGDATPAPGAAGDWEAVEGFWLARPWILTDACPSDALGQSVSAPPSGQSIGLAAVFARDGSRLGRRGGRAYEFTVRPSSDRPLAPPQGGYVARVEGRVTAFPDGRATRCVAYSPEQRPTCVVAVEIDRVAFEDASGSTLSEWRTAG